MKNFPHQYSGVAKVKATLQTIADLGNAGADPMDDGVLGYELVSRGIYTFGGSSYLSSAALAKRISAEKKKPNSKQGPRTAAREGRRTHRFLGFLSVGGQVTDAGVEWLGTTSGSDAERRLLAGALLAGQLIDAQGNSSHPARILLRLVADKGTFHTRDGMELALEAKDDSEGEYQRITGLLAQPKGQRRAALGVGESKMKDAVKILPALAVQAGLLQEVPPRTYSLTQRGIELLKAATEVAIDVSADDPGGVGPPPGSSSQQSLVTPDTAAKYTPGVFAQPQSPEEQADAARLRFERTEQHQALVRDVAKSLPPTGELHEDRLSYDLLWLPPEGTGVLFEVKTVNRDGHTQVRQALGQLLYYDYFVVQPTWPTREVAKAVVTDRTVHDSLAAYLDAHGVGLFRWEGSLIAENSSAEAILGNDLGVADV